MTFKDYLASIKDKKVSVIGATAVNAPLIEALQGAGIETNVRDKKQGIEYLDNISEDIIFRNPADIIFRNPTLMPNHPALVEAVSNGATLTTEMEVFFDVCPCKIIGVAGSDGKTTTAAIIADILRNEGIKVHLGNSTDDTSLLLSADSMNEDDIAVVELSSPQLASMKKSPHIAVVTNVKQNHFGVPADKVEYVEARRNIFAHQSESDRAVFNLDDDITRKYAAYAVADEVLMFSRGRKVLDGIYLEDDHIFESERAKTSVIMPSSDIILPGIHNIENFMAAFAAVRGLASVSAMVKTAQTFKGVPHRTEFVRNLRDIRYYNDSIASTPSRAAAGLRSFHSFKDGNRKNVVLIAGGKDSDMFYDELGSVIMRYVKTLVLTGMTSEKIRNAVEHTPGYVHSGEPGSEHSPEIIMCDDFKTAVTTASDLAEEGDIVLLSPASVPFDKFENFEERGDYFKEIVNGLV